MVVMVDVAEWFWLDRVPGMPVFPRPLIPGKHVLLFYVCGTGLGVSPGCFFKDSIIQREVDYQSLEAGVFLLQFFETVGLVCAQPSILFSPAIIGDIANPNLPCHDRDAGSFMKKDFSLPELVDDLFRRVSFSHYFPPFHDIIFGIVLGGQVIQNRVSF